MSGKTFLPMWTAGMLSCCMNTIRTLGSVEREGHAVKCYVCGVPLHVRNGAWEIPAEGAARDDVNNTRHDGGPNRAA